MFEWEEHEKLYQNHRLVIQQVLCAYCMLGPVLNLEIMVGKNRQISCLHGAHNFDCRPCSDLLSAVQ